MMNKNRKSRRCRCLLAGLLAVMLLIGSPDAAARAFAADQGGAPISEDPFTEDSIAGEYIEEEGSAAGGRIEEEGAAAGDIEEEGFVVGGRIEEEGAAAGGIEEEGSAAGGSVEEGSSIGETAPGEESSDELPEAMEEEPSIEEADVEEEFIPAEDGCRDGGPDAFAGFVNREMNISGSLGDWSAAGGLPEEIGTSGESAVPEDDGEGTGAPGNPAAPGVDGEGGVPEESVDSPGLFSNYASNRLTGAGRTLYGYFTEQFREVAAGRRTSTVFSLSFDYVNALAGLTEEEEGYVSQIVLKLDDLKALGLDESVTCVYTVSSDGKKSIRSDVYDIMKEQIYARYGISLKPLVKALIADCPYDLYWYDKVSSTKYSPGVFFYTDGSGVVFKGSLTFRFPVSVDYQTEDAEADPLYEVDGNIGASVVTAAENALAIVEANADKSDYEKLDAYRAEILERTSYNYSTSGRGYGDPWQLIYVFDGDPSTKVVCEGYSKAFQYLCDLSAFDGIFRECISVTGKMITPSKPGGEGHMWNLVLLQDGRSYLADLTNCDSGTAGAGEDGRGLFLSGMMSDQTPCTALAVGNITDGYTFYPNSRKVRYVYDADSFLNFSDEDLSLAYGRADSSTQEGEAFTANLGHRPVMDEALQPTCTETGLTGGSHCAACKEAIIPQQVIPALGHTWGDSYTIDIPATCTEEGSESIHCSVCGEMEEGTSRPVEKLPHAYGNWETTKEASCTEDGGRMRACTDCGQIDTDVIPSPGHVWNESYTVDDPATCTEEGTESIRCSVCGVMEEGSSRPIPVIPHSYGAWKTLQAATYDSEGLKERSCTECGDTQQQAIPKKERISIAGALVTGLAARTYTGSPVTQTVAVKIGGTALKLNTDYTVKYVDNTSAGTATMKLTGKGKYTGTISKTFKINRAAISKAQISGIKNKTYTGSLIIQAPVLKYGAPTAKTLKKDRDYTLSYKANKNVGTASVVISGKGNFTGTFTKSFSILPKGTMIKTLSGGVKKFTAGWNRQPVQTTGYQLMYSEDQAFGSGNKTVTVKNANTLTVGVSGLKAVTYYYVRIRTFRTVGSKTYYSAWSAAKRVRTKKS